MTHRFFVSLAFLGIAAGFAAGCGSSSTSSGAPPAGVSAEQACKDVAAARCQRLDACGVDVIALRFGDLATCQQRQQDACLGAQSASATAATPATVEQCVAALPSETCADLLNNDTPTACQAPAGPGAIGAGCAFNAQCASRFCAIDKSASCGTCQNQPAAGDSCSALTSCGPGLKCVHQGTVCANVNTATGEACDKDNPCGAGFSCVGAVAATMTQGSCQPSIATMGAACDPKKKTGPGCDANAGLVCDATSSTCVTIQIAAAGAACDGSTIVCGAAATCVIPTGASAGSCVAAASDGAACDSALGPDCMNLSRCIVASDGGTSGFCALPSDASCH